MPKPGEQGSRPTTERGNARRWSWSKVFRKGIVANESDPDGWKDGVGPLDHHGAMWAVIMPPGVTTYTLKVWKLISVYKENGDAIVEEWVLEDEYTLLAKSVVKHQPIDGCRIAATIDDIVVGAGVGDGFTITYNGVNRHL